MLHLVDNDIVLKLGRFDLLHLAVKTWGGSANVRRLGTCRYALCFPDKPAKALKRCGRQIVVDRINIFCDHTSELPPVKNTQVLALMAAVPALDDSEAMIFACCSENPGSLSYTEDKRSILALASEESLADLRKMLVGRVYCLEHVIAMLVASEGLNHVVDAIRSDPNADTALCAIVGNQKPPRLDSIWAGLESYYGALNSSAGGLLAAFPAKPSA